MSNRRDEWLEELDDLINRLHDLGFPEPIAHKIESYLTQVQEDVQEQIELRSTDWEN
jgi:hypothetical protein